MLKLIKQKKWVFTAVGVFVSVIAYASFSGGNGDVEYDFAEVAYVDIIQDVSVTGTVEADSKIDLRFQAAGQVEKVYFEVGDFVSNGEVLAHLDTIALSIKVTAAGADVALANANYNLAVAGSTDEAVLVAAAAVAKAEADLNQSQQSLASTQILANAAVNVAELDYQAALTDYENAGSTYGENIEHAYGDAYNVLDEVFNEVDDTLRDIDNILGVDNEAANDDIELALQAYNKGDYNSAQATYSNVQSLYNNLFDVFSDEVNGDDMDVIDELLGDCAELLDDTDDLLDDVDDILVSAPILGGLTQTLKDSTRVTLATEMNDMNNISTSLDNTVQAIDSADTSEETYLANYANDLAKAEQLLATAEAQAEADINSAEVSIDVYEALLAQAEASLADIESGPRGVDLASLNASITSAQASLDLAEYNLAEAYIKAPVSGVVTEIYFDAGENITAAEDFLVMVSEEYQIVANVSETDISKVKVGDKVMMTLDAFSYEKEFEAEIVEVDPAETVVQGVIYYQITAVFVADDAEIKPGMTANMDIVTAEVHDVLAVPIRAIKYDGSRTYVFMLDGSDLIEVDVKTGVEGAQYIEILSGLEDGDEIVTYVR